MPVEGARLELLEQRGLLGRVATEAQQVLDPELALPGREQRGIAHPGHLVPQGPHGVESHRLVTGGVGDQVGFRTLRVAETVVHGVEEE